MYISDKVKLDAVLSYCAQQHTDAFRYGWAMGFFNKQSALTKLGERVAKVVLTNQSYGLRFETNEVT